MQNVDTTTLTVHDFYTKLAEKVSNYNAKLMIQTALISSGLSHEDHSVLNKEEAKAICLALINRGGPAFQVGRDMYQKVQ